ncbi:hypothetical protein EON82_06150 [bacterium]|nr:MAG: hypothetical protein EON82_06150 [bacterium]
MARKRVVMWPWVTVAVFVALGTVAWQSSDLGRASGDLARQRAAAKREGVPTEWADLRRVAPPIPDADNAAIPYSQAFHALQTASELKGGKFRDLILAIPNGTAKPSEVQALKAALVTTAPALTLVKEGSRRPGLYFNRPWEKGAALLFPEYSHARNLARALVLRAMVSNHPAEAADDLRTAARLRAHLASEPVLIGALVANSIETDVHQGVRYLGRRGGAWTAAVAPVLEDLGKIPALRKTLTAEAVWGANFSEEIRKAGGIQAFTSGDGQVPIEMKMMGFAPARRAMEARVYEYWRKAWKELPEDPTDFRRASEALKMPSREKGPSYAMLEVLLPVFDQFTQTNARAEADRRLTRVALDLWSGKAPTLPKDPFGNGPLRMKRNGSDWTLYSVGPDGADNAARTQSESGGKPYDIVVKSR